MSKTINEQNLIEGLKRRDDECIRYIYQKSFSFVCGFVLKNKGTAEDAKDLLQDGILILFENILHGIFKEKSGITTYLNNICRNQWLNYLTRRKSRYISFEDYSSSLDYADEDNDTNDSAEIGQKTYEMLMASSERCREIILSFYYQKLSMIEIAAKFGYTNADNAKNQKAKCLDKLRNAVKTITLKPNNVI
jgi:RNA polymerase sigma factor (sigma-70 family)